MTVGYAIENGINAIFENDFTTNPVTLVAYNNNPVSKSFDYDERFNENKTLTDEEKKIKNREKCKKYKKENAEKIKEYNKKYRELHGDEINRKKREERAKNKKPRKVRERKPVDIEAVRAKDREYYKENKEKVLAKKKKKYAENLEIMRERSRLNGLKQYELHSEEFKERAKKYRSENREYVLEYDRKRYREDTKRIEWVASYIREYTQRPHVKMAIRKRTAIRRRELGFEPINTIFEGAEFHHMYLNGSNGIGIFIPHDVHRSIKHSRISMEGMREINKMSLLWLCEQPTINVYGGQGE